MYSSSKKIIIESIQKSHWITNQLQKEQLILKFSNQKYLFQDARYCNGMNKNLQINENEKSFQHEMKSNHGHQP